MKAKELTETTADGYEILYSRGFSVEPGRGDMCLCRVLRCPELDVYFIELVTPYDGKSFVLPGICLTLPDGIRRADRVTIW